MDAEVHSEGGAPGELDAPDLADRVPASDHGERALVEVLERSRGARLAAPDRPRHVMRLLNGGRREPGQGLAVGSSVSRHVADRGDLGMAGNRAVGIHLDVPARGPWPRQLPWRERRSARPPARPPPRSRFSTRFALRPYRVLIVSRRSSIAVAWACSRTVTPSSAALGGLRRELLAERRRARGRRRRPGSRGPSSGRSARTRSSACTGRGSRAGRRSRPRSARRRRRRRSATRPGPPGRRPLGLLEAPKMRSRRSTASRERLQAERGLAHSSWPK